LRRRAADGRDGRGADVEAEAAADGRALDGARADPRRAQLRDHQAGARVRCRDARRRAERERVALHRRSRVRALDRTARARGAGRISSGGRRPPQGIFGSMTDVVATVVATRSSAPRPVGSKLIVREDGSLEGSVSGGCVENDVVVAAQEVRETGVPRLVTYGITDDMACSVGLPCGGEIDVFVEPLGEQVDSGVVLTVICGEGVGEKLDDPELERAALRRGRSHVIELGDRSVFADVFAEPPRLLVYGAVDTAEALCASARLLGWRTIVADARPRFATAERIPSADELLVVWPDEALAHVSPDAATAVVVLTHDDKFDLPLVRGALATDAFYVGWLGSRRNQERRR